MKTWTRKFIIVTCLLLAACSQEWREADAGLTGDEMLLFLDEVSVSASSNNGVSQALAYKDDPNTTIFYADAPGPLGKMPELLALEDLDFLGTGQDLYYGNIRLARIFFLDSPSTTDRQDGLIFGIALDDGQYKYYGFSGQGTINTDGLFEAKLTGDNGNRVTIRSWDTEGDELNGVIQLRVYEYDSAGNEYYIGKITTLVGYGS